jgi:hypothetical protein
MMLKKEGIRFGQKIGRFGGVASDRRGEGRGGGRAEERGEMRRNGRTAKIKRKEKKKHGRMKHELRGPIRSTSSNNGEWCFFSTRASRK